MQEDGHVLYPPLEALGGGIAVIIIVYTFMIRETGRQILYVKIIASRRCGRNRVCYVIMDGTGMMDMKDA